MQTAQAQDGRVERRRERRSDLFDPHFPRIRAVAEAASPQVRPSLYDPHFPQNARADRGPHISM